MTSESSSSRSSSSADSYVGSLISLTSKSEIRYEGVLYNINTEESSIGLRNVRSFGTEGRKKDGPQIPPSDKVYEYILFRGSDIKDLQVKSSPPVQPTPPINNDPAIIQSHYSQVSTSSSLPSSVSGSLPDLNSHTAQFGLPGSNFQGGVPLYQPGVNLGSWGASPPPPTANGSGLAMPMYWQGYYGPPSGLPSLHQQSLLRPTPGLPIPPPMQQPMQYPNFNASLPTGASSFPGTNLPEVPSPLLPVSSSSINSSSSLFPPPMLQPMQYPNFNASLPTGASSLPGTNLPEVPSPLLPVSSSSINSSSSLLPSATLPSMLPPAPSTTLASEALLSTMPNRAPSSILPTATPSTSLPPPSSLITSSPELSAIVPPISNKPNAISGQTLSYQSISQSTSSTVGASNSICTETPTPSLVTPGQLLQSGATTIPSSLSSQTAHKDVEVVQVSKSSSEPSAPVMTEAQPPILPLPLPARSHRKANGPHQTRHGYSYRGRERGRGTGSSRPVTKFTEDFDFVAMNEKFKKDEVWGDLGKSNKSHSKNKEVDENVSDEDCYQDEDDAELSKPVYNKDDFFDTISCNALDSNGRTKFSEQMKLDTETFGEFSRYRGGRGPGRGGRFRGSYYGRGYGYAGRGRGRSMASRPS